MPSKPDRCTRARAIEAFSNFRSVEAPGWTRRAGTGGIRFRRRRDARTSVQWKPLLTTTCAWQLSAPGHRQLQRRRRSHDFLPEERTAPRARSIFSPTNGASVFSFLSAFKLSKRRPVAHYVGFNSNFRRSNAVTSNYGPSTSICDSCPRSSQNNYC